jgi:chromosome segregation ATPase
MVVENKGMDDIDSIKEKLLAVSNEIDTIKNSFSKNTEDLSRIQRMLSIGDLEDLGGMIEKFEYKIAEAEKQKREVAEGAKKYSEELEKEKERLVKLWDAYKNQEEELSTVEKKISEYEDRLRTAETSKKQLENDLTSRINTLTQKLDEYQGKEEKINDYKQKYEEFDNIKNQLEIELSDLKTENSSKERIINDLNNQILKLREKENFSQYKDKFEAVNAEYEKEKERLTKLYNLYEETNSECTRLKEENQNWQSWYNSNKDIFSRLFSTNPPIAQTSYTPEQPIQPDEPIEDPTKNKKRSIFRR